MPETKNDMELVLSNFGTSLGRDNNGFVVTNADGRQRIPAGGLKSIMISKGTQVSSDAVMLAVENEIEILFVDRGGKPLGRVWSPKYGSISTIRKGQLEFCAGPDAVQWIKTILSRKIENQEALMLMMNPGDRMDLTNYVNKSLNRMEKYRMRIEKLEGDSIADISSKLRGLEGVASKVYFETVNKFLPEKYRFAQRTQHPAMDVTNAMLNYGYGILYSRIEGMMIRVGIDPYLGVMHRDDYNRPVLVYDMIEQYRFWIDYVVFSLISQHVITEDCYSIGEDGACWLETLGRRILIQSVNDYLEETIPGDGMNRTRLNHMFNNIQELAQSFKK